MRVIHVITYIHDCSYVGMGEGVISFDCCIITALVNPAVKYRKRVTTIVWRFLSIHPSVRPSIRPNPPVLNGKGRLRESAHSRHKGIMGV